MTDDGEPQTEQEEVDARSERGADARAAASSDPVGAYLRTMMSFSLLTREDEIEIAKRIEDGQRRVLQVALDSSVAVDNILSLGDELRQARLRVRDVVTNVD